MIMDKNRSVVIENIKSCIQNKEFNKKTEVSDPILTKEQEKQITSGFMAKRKTLSYKIKRAVALSIAKPAARIINRDTKIIGIEKIPQNMGGVIITSNHFSPLENTVIRHLTNKLKRRDLAIISQTSNFAMKGFLGFIMNYADTIPISIEPRYLATSFLSVLKEKLVEKKQAVLLYPEQELWFNYRKPRPPKDGAYFYAAKLNVPVISCFVEIVDTERRENSEFKKVKYILHVLGVIYPDKEISPRENTAVMSQKDYLLKKECYERVYGKKLIYDFQNSDIAGWVK